MKPAVVPVVLIIAGEGNAPCPDEATPGYPPNMAGPMEEDVATPTLCGCGGANTGGINGPRPLLGADLTELPPLVKCPKGSIGRSGSPGCLSDPGKPPTPRFAIWTVGGAVGWATPLESGPLGGGPMCCSPGTGGEPDKFGNDGSIMLPGAPASLPPELFGCALVDIGPS